MHAKSITGIGVARPMVTDDVMSGAANVSLTTFAAGQGQGSAWSQIEHCQVARGGAIDHHICADDQIRRIDPEISQIDRAPGSGEFQPASLVHDDIRIAPSALCPSSDVEVCYRLRSTQLQSARKSGRRVRSAALVHIEKNFVDLYSLFRGRIMRFTIEKYAAARCACQEKGEVMLSATLTAGLNRYKIGPKIRALRSAKGMGLAQLAEHTGLSPALLSKVERGQLFTTLPTLLRIAMVLASGWIISLRKPRNG
jgi:Helix-turn-helix domain